MGAESVAERLRSLLESRHKEKDEEKQKQKNDFNNNKSHTQTSTSARVDKFLPGRSCYVYHLDGDDDEKGGELNFDDPFRTGIPTTVYRSKSEYTQQKFKYVLKLEEDAPIIARLAGVLGYMRKGSKGSHTSSGGGRGGVFSSSSTGKGKDPKGFQKSPSSAEQLKRETPQQGAVAVAEADSEDDIFADCGTDFNEDEDGEAEMKRETKVGDYGGNGSSRYFSGLGGDGTGAEESEKRVREKKQARAREEVTYTYRDLEDQEDRDVMEVRQKKHEGLGDEGNWHQVMKSGEDDAYADLFPGYGAGLDDEEEEDDGEKALVTTIDEEEAAGEGGDKSTTRAKGKGKMKANSKSSTKDVKLNTEYSKMKELFKEKGFGNATAFEEAEEEPGEGSSKGNAKKKNKNKNKKDANDSGDVTFQPRQKRLRL